MAEVLWQPSAERIAATNFEHFRTEASAKFGLSLKDFWDVHQWSVDAREQFWGFLWDYAGVIGERGSERVLDNVDAMPGADWFPDAKLNFAENLLRRSDDKLAFIFQGEDQVRREVTYAELNTMVSRLAQALKAAGIGPGDRVGGYLPNMPETIAAMLVFQRRARRVEVTRGAADPLSVGGGRRGRKPPARGSERRGRHLLPAPPRPSLGNSSARKAAGKRRRSFRRLSGCAAKQKRRRGHPHVRTSQRRRRACPRTSPRASRRARASARGRPPSRLAALPRREPGRDSRRDRPGRTAVVRSPRATAASRARLASLAARQPRHDLTPASP